MKEKSVARATEYIKSWLEFQYNRNEIPGFVVAINHKDNIVFNEAYGHANIEDQVKLTPDHIFRVASHSKTFTATALMQLQEQGKLRIDDYVVDYLVWLKSHQDNRWSKVTIRQLMSHGAGVIRDGENADYWQLDIPFPSAEELIAEVLKARLVFENNIKLKYSNIGYSLLGLIIEQVSGMSYNEYVTQNIVTELHLKDTGPEYNPVINNRLVTGYTRRDLQKNRLPIVNIDTHAMSPATGFYSTARDLCLFFAAQKVGASILLNDESKKEMQRVHFRAKVPANENSADYGLGLEITYINGHVAYGHSGGFPGQITNTFVFPENKLVIVVFTNCIDGPAYTIAKSVMGILDYFENNVQEEASKHDMSKFQGRFMNMWGVSDIVATGDKIVSASPSSWEPFNVPEKLEFVDEQTLKIIETSSFDSEGELVHYHFNDNGSVASISYGGYTMWPEVVWWEMQAGKKVIG